MCGAENSRLEALGTSSTVASGSASSFIDTYDGHAQMKAAFSRKLRKSSEPNWWRISTDELVMHKGGLERAKSALSRVTVVIYRMFSCLCCAMRWAVPIQLSRDTKFNTKFTNTQTLAKNERRNQNHVTPMLENALMLSGSCFLANNYCSFKWNTFAPFCVI